MKVVIIGAGYVGLVSGCCFAEFGADVTCIDLDEARISDLQKGHIPIYEPGLDQLLARNTEAGRLSFTTDLSLALPTADLVFLAVGTPSRRGDGHADLSYVYGAATQVARYLSGYTVIVNKSTVPVGTARQVRRIIAEADPEADFDVASNRSSCERCRHSDFMRPDKIVIAWSPERAEGLLRALTAHLTSSKHPLW